MNKRKTIYKSFNKRRKMKSLKFISAIICICLLGGITVTKLKDVNILNKISQKINKSISSINLLNNNKIEQISYDDISKELDKVQVEKEKDKEVLKEENKAKTDEDIKVAVIDGLDIYTIQVASVENENDIPKIETSLNENKIPFSTVEIDGLKKIQTYASFEQDSVRNYIEEVRKVFPDAFVSQIKIPVLSLEYTQKYSYVEGISNKLNELIKNFEEESKFWESNKENIDIQLYTNILNSRANILSDIKNEANKIDYSNMKVFKDNLIKYTDETNNKINISLKSINEKDYNISKSLYLSSIQGYFLFINSIKEA